LELVVSIKAIRGFKDILPEETPYWRQVERCAQKLLENFGYREIRIPVLERTELFARSIGEVTDIVEKEMFTFPDRHGDPLTLRPEATAGIVRSVLEHNLASDGRPLKLFFMGPMFRYERPQKGRQRQFHQLDVEVFNDPTPHADAELIILLDRFLEDLGLSDVEMHVNSLGCRECRPEYKTRLTEFLGGRKADLCPDCQRRIDTNPLRVIDCKVPRCKELVQDAPRITDTICGECKDHFQGVQDLLIDTGFKYVIDANLVRGLDYYMRTTFEAQTGELGAQNAVAGGGRYDGLAAALGGSDVPGTGFAAGLERLIMLMMEKGTVSVQGPDVFVAALDDAAVKAVFPLVQELRRRGVNVETDYAPSSLKSKMKRADKLGAAEVFIIGPEELSSGTIIRRNMATGAQSDEPLDIDRLTAVLDASIHKEN
jgi:histidyl-tRNA synthetase